MRTLVDQNNFPQKVHRILSKATREQKFSGAVLIRQEKTELFRRAYGLANRNFGVKNTPDTRFRIASVGKIMTAPAVLQLVEAGQITLESRVVDVLNLQGTRIPEEATIYHLLTMTAGIADWTNEESENFEAEWVQFCREHPLYLLRTGADYLPIFLNQEPYFKLGEKHSYSNSSFILLGEIVAKLSGMSYFEYMSKRIFTPAGMTATAFLDLDDVVPNVAEGYVPVMDTEEHITGWKKNYYATTAGGAGDGGQTSTLDDMARFLDALRGGKLISKKSVDALASPQVVESAEDYQGYKLRYGFGCFLMLNSDNSIMRWGHTGEEDGVSCRVWHYPRQNVDLILLGNQSFCAGNVSWDLQSLILNLPAQS